MPRVAARNTDDAGWKRPPKMTTRRPSARPHTSVRVAKTADTNLTTPEERRRLRALIKQAVETGDASEVREYAITKSNLPSESPAHEIAEWLMSQLQIHSKTRRRVHGAIMTVSGLVQLLGP